MVKDPEIKLDPATPERNERTRKVESIIADAKSIGYRDGFAAGQAAERKRIEEAPRATLISSANGTLWVYPDRQGSHPERWRPLDPKEIKGRVALVPLSPTPQQESEPDYFLGQTHSALALSETGSAHIEALGPEFAPDPNANRDVMPYATIVLTCEYAVLMCDYGVSAVWEHLDTTPDADGEKRYFGFAWEDVQAIARKIVTAFEVAGKPEEAHIKVFHQDVVVWEGHADTLPPIAPLLKSDAP